MLRSWNDRAREEPWDRLRIVLVLSTSPTLVARSTYGSPFRVSPVEVGDFSRDETDALARRYGITCTPDTRARIEQTVGGHPMMLAAVFHGVAVDGLAPAAACDAALNSSLRHALLRAAPQFQRHGELRALLEAIARSPGAPLTASQQREVGPLEAAGLVRREGRGYGLRLPIFRELLR